MAQTKTFMVRGTSNYSGDSIELELKVNSAKQAQDRFLKKYDSILAGYWYFSILDSTKHFNQVGAFEIGKESGQGINKTVKNQKELFNKTVNDVPMLNHGLVGDVPAKYSYQDETGDIHYWYGIGRKPVWWIELRA